MLGRRRAFRQSDGQLLPWIIGLTIGLALLYGVLALFVVAGEVITIIPSYTPLTRGFATLAAVGIAFLSFGRYQVLRQPPPFWIGLSFSIFSVFSLFFTITFPGLRPDGQGILGQLPGTSAWLGVLQISALAFLLPVAIFARWPRAGAAGERWWPGLVLAVVVVSALIGWLSLAFEQFLPLLVVDVAYTPLLIWWADVLVLAFVVGAMLSTYRHWQTDDLLFAYLAMTQLLLVFALLAIINSGGRRFDAWFYLGPAVIVAAVSVMLFGLLSEYVGLYRREQQKTRELEVLINTALVGIVFVSAPDGRPLLFNEAAETILGQPVAPEVSFSDQLSCYGLYRFSGDPFPPDELPAGRSLDGEVVVGVEMLIRQPSGREVYLLNNSAPVRDAKGQIVGAVLVFQDITRVKEQERLRDEFISAAAHELKTPVTMIKGYAELMRRWTPREREAREGQVIEVINVQVDRINRRVQEMLEAVRLRKAPPELVGVRFDLGDLVSEAVRRLQAATELNRLLLKREGPVPVEADRERIEEVLVNLLENAIRYSPQGGDIEVRVWSQAGEALVLVKDHGVGIPKERQPHIFEPFYEPVPAGSPGYRSIVPLSLYLSKLNIERHKGRIWFESEVGKGSTFNFSLPLAKEDGNGRGE